jgi:hypothetical protein
MQNPSQRELIEIWQEHDVYCSLEDDDDENTPISGISFHGTKNADSLCHYILLAPQAEDISFDRSDVTAKGLAYLKGHSNLRAVYLDDTEVEGAGYEVLTTLPKLRTLSCSPRHDTHVALSWIGQLTKLTNLRISNSKIVDADLSAIRHLTELTNLDITNANIDAGLTVIAQFSKLTWLSLSNIKKISAKTLEMVRLAKSVRKFFLEGVSLENDALAQIAQMENLTYLCFVGDRVDAVGIEYLSQLKSLEGLTIEELVIAPEIVAAVAKLKTLRELRLRSKIDPGTAKALKRALPRCKVSLWAPLT